MVSIIIPYIDEHDYLAEAIASAVGQLDIEREIIVICNAPAIPDSKDFIPGVIEAIQFIHEPRPGSANARNAGLRQAKGEWIQFLDVDDLLHPDKIYHQAQHTHADVIVSPHTYQFLNGKRENSKWLSADVWIGLLNSGLGSTSSMLWKREALIEAEGWNPSYHSHQEYELLFRLASKGKLIVFDDHCETIVRQRESGSITANTKSIRIREGMELREKMWNHLVAHGEDTRERFEAFRQYIFRQLRGLYRQNQAEALAAFQKYFSTPPFTPKDIHVPGYGMMYRVFGFKRTEEIILRIILRRCTETQS